MAINPAIPPRPKPPRGASPRQLSARVPAGRARIDARGIARRRVLISWTKRLLPVLALLLLASIAVWPQLDRLQQQSRVTYRNMVRTDPTGARVTDPHYRGVDERGRPYTLTASLAEQTGEKRFDLTDPKADITSDSASWLMVEARHGVYDQAGNILDLAGDVTLHRDDGTTVQTATATMDLKLGTAANAAPLHAEGPFGVLDASGFSITDKGDVLQFAGPARLTLNQVAN